MRDNFRSAPARRRVVRIAAVAESELELVVARRRRLERAAADVHDLPRLARRIREPRAERVIVEGIDGAVLVGAAARREPVAPPVPGVLRVHEQVRAEDVVVLDLPQAVQLVQRPIERIEVPLVPEEAVVRVARLAWIAAELLLRAVEIEEGELVVLTRGPVDLGVGVLQERAVERLIQTEKPDVLLSVRAPEPELVPDDRPANVESDVQDLIRMVRFVRSAEPRVALERIGQVGRLHRVVVQGELDVATNLSGRTVVDIAVRPKVTKLRECRAAIIAARKSHSRRWASVDPVSDVELSRFIERNGRIKARPRAESVIDADRAVIDRSFGPGRSAVETAVNVDLILRADAL